MWTTITDCGKQLTLHSKLREKDDEQVKLYEVSEVEFDQYKLKLIGRDNLPMEAHLEQIFTCQQLIQYGFEVEENDL